jgi:hypothetical protein
MVRILVFSARTWLIAKGRNGSGAEIQTESTKLPSGGSFIARR